MVPVRAAKRDTKMSATRNLLIPRNPRAGVIFSANDARQETVIRYLMQIIGAGRYFKTNEFEADWRERYNVYFIGGPVIAGVLDEKVTEFVAANHDWLEQQRVVLFGFCPTEESAEAGLQPICDLLGNAVLDQITIGIGPVGLNLPAISQIGLRMKHLKDDGGTKLPPHELKEHIESFLNMRKHCVLCTGHNGEVRATSVSYTYHDGHVYIMSEGSGKFANLLLNDRVSIAMFAPRMRASKVAGIQLSGKTSIWHPDSDEYRRIVDIKGSDYERLRSFPFILWALDVKIETAEFWWGDLTDQGYAPRQVYHFGDVNE